MQLGYCTNVHAGADLESTRANLQRHALAVKSRFSPDQPMGVGLWLSAQAARKLLEAQRSGEWQHWLGEVGLIPFTLNGFPYGDFHEKVVKHRVYEPTWWEKTRLDYTLDLITILQAILPANQAGSISTLPIAWGTPTPSPEHLQQAARHLVEAANTLAKLESDRNHTITLCLEPEPGCYLQRSEDVISFFKDYLLPIGDEKVIRRHLTVCHDICHASVMFEDQVDVVRRFQDAGIKIGKVQVSTAIRLQLDPLSQADRREALAQLSQFAEDRYLHQTSIRSKGETEFFVDLPQALASQKLEGEWRVHFHVPIYRENFGLISSSQNEIRPCLDALHLHSDVQHFEVETYAWSVLPQELRPTELAVGIAEEMKWFRNLSTYEG